mmetsp:Transcript_7559/g.22415  ORF Transcript_7559/g.22415 Transcript_7559/m.22415 type:complete len:255 (-) Transcript_7559:190-954(-)
MRGRSRPMKAWRPPALATTSAPGCTRRWYVLQNMRSTPAAAASWADTALSAAFVPTGTKQGVSMTPWGVWMRPTRARDTADSCTTSNRKCGFSALAGNVSGPGGGASGSLPGGSEPSGFGRLRLPSQAPPPVSSPYRAWSRSRSASRSARSASPHARSRFVHTVMPPLTDASSFSCASFSAMRFSSAATSAAGAPPACLRRRSAFFRSRAPSDAAMERGARVRCPRSRRGANAASLEMNAIAIRALAQRLRRMR